MFMHPIALCIPCITLFNCDHLLHIKANHVEPKTEIEAEQIQWVFEGPQAPSVRILTLLLYQGKPRCIPPIILGFSFNLYNYVLLDYAFKFIGIE
jgi:hypothetical protein